MYLVEVQRVFFFLCVCVCVLLGRLFCCRPKTSVSFENYLSCYIAFVPLNVSLIKLLWQLPDFVHGVSCSYLKIHSWDWESCFLPIYGCAGLVWNRIWDWLIKPHHLLRHIWPYSQLQAQNHNILVQAFSANSVIINQVSPYQIEFEKYCNFKLKSNVICIFNQIVISTIIYIYIYIQASSQLNITGSQLFSDSIHAVAHDTFYHKRFPF